MTSVLATFNELTTNQLYDFLWLRQEAFIVEQACAYSDIDGWDAKAIHLLIYDNSRLAAYLRIFSKGVKYTDAASMGRIVVRPEYRATGLGKSLIEKGIRYCGNHPIRIEAQAALQHYYEKYDFVRQGEVYELDGIKHIEMLRA